MKIQNEMQLAEMIVQLDIMRDQLYEDLQNRVGSKGNELLRSVQNCRSQQDVSFHYTIDERRDISLAFLEVMFITAKHKIMAV